VQNIIIQDCIEHLLLNIKFWSEETVITLQVTPLAFVVGMHNICEAVRDFMYYMAEDKFC
jgi:hypothetical protein